MSEAALTGVALGLLGGEVLRGAHDRAGKRHVRGAGAGDPEVGDLRAALLVEDHVVGLEVAVDHPAAVREARSRSIWMTMSIAAAGSSGPCSRTTAFSERPGRYSIAM